MLVRAAFGTIVAIGVVSCGSKQEDNLPPHTVETSELSAKDQRVQINVSTPLSDSECEALISRYLYTAGPGGQVSVHTPSAALNGQIAPFCVENLDGKGVVFNRSLF